MNLLKETLDILHENSLSEKDVLWVGDDDGITDWNNFAEIANVEYGHVFLSEVNLSLLIVGNDWWLERHECDGDGWWEFKRYPEKPNKKVTMNTVLL